MLKRFSLVWVVLFSLVLSPKASASTITWFGSGEVEGIFRQANRFAGLTVGTPWSLTFEVNPNAAPSFSLGGGCNGYFDAVGPSMLTLGPYTYRSSRGTIYTQHDFPGGGCNAGGIVRTGVVQFLMGQLKSDDPNAWNFDFTSFTVTYEDAVARDGSIPLVPTYLPGSQGASFYTTEQADFWHRLGPARFEVLAEQPSPVPEPATLTLFAGGLAAVIARRRRQRDG